MQTAPPSWKTVIQSLLGNEKAYFLCKNLSQEKGTLGGTYFLCLHFQHRNEGLHFGFRTIVLLLKHVVLSFF